MEQRWQEFVSEIPNLPPKVKEELFEKLTEDIFKNLNIHPQYILNLKTLEKNQQYAVYLVINDILFHSRNINKAITKMRKIIKGKKLTIKDEKFYYTMDFIKDVILELNHVVIDFVEGDFLNDFIGVIEKNIPEAKFFANPKWNNSLIENLNIVVEKRTQKRGSRAKFIKLISENTGLSVRQSERYLDGEQRLTAEAILMFEEVLNVHRDSILGNINKRNSTKISQITAFRRLFNLMKKDDELSEDLKKILEELAEAYEQIITNFESKDSMKKMTLSEKVRDELIIFINEMKNKMTT